MNKKGNLLAKKMMWAMGFGVLAGLAFLFLRESLTASGNLAVWKTIHRWLFQDITTEEGKNAIGLFYLLGQLFINALQVIIVPMVFTSITLAICRITDTRKLGRISSRTVLIFLLTSMTALIFAGIVGMFVYSMGAFRAVNADVAVAAGASASNPLTILLEAVPNNLISAFSNNSKVLSNVVLAIATGLAIHTLNNQVTVLKKLLQEISDIITICLSYIISAFGPIAIFVLLTRTFAIYGVDYLIPAMAYVVTTVMALLIFLLVGYALFVRGLAKLNPIPFLRKIAKVAIFGFSTSSSAATLPLTRKTCCEELGVSDDVASFTLPLGMTINMDGTAIMQVIAAIFIAASAGYQVRGISVLIIALLALVASIGTPAAPGAGAVILFTILTGMGYTNDAALLAYSLILAINRPIEMLVTSLNVVGDAAACVIVAKKEKSLDLEQYKK